MRFAVAADHAGFLLKDRVIGVLRDLGHDVEDLGTADPALPDDYPDYALAIGRAIGEGRALRAVLLCGSGVGASVAASKIPGIRAAVCHDTYSAHQGVEHDDLNVLCIGSRVVGEALAADLVRAFAAAVFSGEARHIRRLRKVLEIERRFLGNEADGRIQHELDKPLDKPLDPATR